MQIRICKELYREKAGGLWNVKLLVGIPQGVYHVDFDRKLVTFQEGETWRSKECLELYVEKFKLKSDEKGLLRLPLTKWQIPNEGRIANYLLVEYLDKEEEANGEELIELHSHDAGIREVYLSLFPPFRGEVCGFDEEHKPFAWPTLAIKHEVAFK